MGEHPAAPEHVDKREVDEQLPRDEEDQIRLERDPVREGAGDQGRRDDREHHLVRDEDDQRDVRRAEHRKRTNAAQERLVEVAVDSAVTTAEAERISDRPPQDRRDAHRGEALHHYRERVRPADKATVEKGKARGHQHHQARRDQHEARVRRVEDRSPAARGHVGTRISSDADFDHENVCRHDRAVNTLPASAAVRLQPWTAWRV